jgi:hypothetical protein
VAFDPVVAATLVPPVAGNPDRVRARGFRPAAGDPDVASAIPAVKAADPDPAGMGTVAGVFDDDRRRADADVDALGKSRGHAEDGSRGDEEQFLHLSGISFRGKIELRLRLML